MIWTQLNAQFAQQFGPKKDEPLPWNDDPDDDSFYDDVAASDLPPPLSFPLGQDDEE